MRFGCCLTTFMHVLEAKCSAFTCVQFWQDRPGDEGQAQLEQLLPQWSRQETVLLHALAGGGQSYSRLHGGSMMLNSCRCPHARHLCFHQRVRQHCSTSLHNVHAFNAVKSGISAIVMPDMLVNHELLFGCVGGHCSSHTAAETHITVVCRIQLPCYALCCAFQLQVAFVTNHSMLTSAHDNTIPYNAVCIIQTRPVTTALQCTHALHCVLLLCVQSIAVKPGEVVKKGQLVAYVGAYNGKNAHLHLGVSSGNPCDLLKTCTPADTRACK